jgi:hypothetical protein
MINIPVLKPGLFSTSKTLLPLIPTLSSNTGSNGFATGSGAFSTTFDFWKAFDANDSTEWAPVGIGAGEWIGYRFNGAGKIVKQYTASIQFTSQNYNYEFQGSTDNGNTWTALHNQTASLGGMFPITSSVQYNVYRIYGFSPVAINMKSMQLYG